MSRSTPTEPSPQAASPPRPVTDPPAPPLGPNEIGCPNCASPNDIDRTFCVRCGELLRPISEPVQAAVVPSRSGLAIGGRPAIAGVAIVGILIVLLAVFLGPLSSSPHPSSSPVASVAVRPVATSAAPTAGTSASAAGSPSSPPPSTAPAAVTLTGTIVYANGDAGTDDIYLRDAGGGSAKAIIKAKGMDWDPDLSTDGKRIAWSSPEGIRIADITGKNGWLLTHHANHDQSPAWSPDDKTIAFASDRSGDFEIFLRPVVKGTAELDQVTDNAVPDLEPTWAPDGQSIVFTRGEKSAAELILLDLITRKETRLTKNAFGDVDPSWSPDGKSLAFSSDREGGYDVYVMDLATRKVSRLTTDGAGNHDPAWSPDGRYIAYQALSDTTTKDLFVVDVATGEVVHQFKQPGNDRWASWR
jgi:dipeptidyl aminopeptidase/acylaminoacyl peptidase